MAAAAADSPVQIAPWNAATGVGGQQTAAAHRGHSSNCKLRIPTQVAMDSTACLRESVRRCLCAGSQSHIHSILHRACSSQLSRSSGRRRATGNQTRLATPQAKAHGARVARPAPPTSATRQRKRARGCPTARACTALVANASCGCRAQHAIARCRLGVTASITRSYQPCSTIQSSRRVETTQRSCVPDGGRRVTRLWPFLAEKVPQPSWWSKRARRPAFRGARRPTSAAQ